MTDICSGLAWRQRVQTSRNRNSLTKLKKLGGGQPGCQLRLTCENDLHELLARGLKVRKHSNLLEDSIIHTLRLINRHHNPLAFAEVLQEQLIQLHLQLAEAALWMRNTEFGQKHPQ